MKKLFFVLLALLIVGCSSPPAQPAPTPIVPPSEVVPAPQHETVTPTTPPASGVWTGKTAKFTMSITRDGFSPHVLTVPWNTSVKITLMNDDSVQHSFDVPPLSLARTLAPQETVVISFISSTKGDFVIDDRYGSSDGNLIVGGET
ncbi:MAG TPA: cupredoxin domain-containing protein [Candidatus Binatia bacterium]|nr:cupredoxin domain-containing protein [Candidatus Binatia bacterium]